MEVGAGHLCPRVEGSVACVPPGCSRSTDSGAVMWPPSHSLSPSARALDFGYLTQDMIDDYEPALMFTIPRLAIVW